MGARSVNDGADVTAPQALWRGLRRRCPRCSGGGLFERGFRMTSSCPTCALNFERNPGAFIGGIGLNTSVTVVLMVAALILSFVLLDGPWYVLVLPVLAVALIVPVVFFASSKTLWLALEFVVLPPDPWD